jgi:(S)-2-hydroxyglutarate dehydrogenase
MSPTNSAQYDFIVVGGGIVGLATAVELSNRYRDCKLLLLEKENAVGQHQSGRNSGVLHSGIYYKPGSLKATTCREGKLAMEQFCSENKIAFERCGKIIVALDDAERLRLDAIYQRGIANGINCCIIDQHQIKQLEPHSAGIAAIHVPEAGIVDYPAVCNRLKDLLIEAGHSVQLGQRVSSIQSTSQQIEVSTTSNQSYRAGYLITCGGLYSDKLAEMSGLQPGAKIVPFRGEYYELREDCRHLCKNLIYPVPDPSFPFLGVHFTRMIHGEVECGPNAVLALAREGYDWTTVSIPELAGSLSYGGFLKIASRHWKTGLGEIKRSLFKSAFVKALQRLIPEIRSEHLKPCRAGVRAQAIAADGSIVDDFLWLTQNRSLHVCNAPSPAATASLAIAKQIVDRAAQEFA